MTTTQATQALTNAQRLVLTLDEAEQTNPEQTNPEHRAEAMRNLVKASRTYLRVTTGKDTTNMGDDEVRKTAARAAAFAVLVDKALTDTAGRPAAERGARIHQALENHYAAENRGHR